MYLLLLTVATATVPDTFGVGGRWMGAGGGGVALIGDGSSALVNPAGLSRVRRPTTGLGILAGFHQFQPAPEVYWDTNRDGALDERDSPLAVDVGVDPAAGVSLHMARQIGGKFGIGLAAYVPTRGLIRFATFEPELPTYFMYENRPHRYVASAGVGGEVFPGFSIGASVEMMAKARFDMSMTLDATLVGPDEGADSLEDSVGSIVVDIHDLDMRLVPAFGPMIGLQYHFGPLVPALEGLRIGASYRAAVGLDIRADLDMQANVSVSDVGDLDPYITSVILGAGIALADHYQPARFVGGLGYERADAFSVYADLRWTDWSKMRFNITNVDNVTLTAPFVDIDDFVVDGNPYDITLRPVTSFRIGGEIRMPEWSREESKLRYLRVSARGGFGWEPSPLVTQSDQSALLDANRMLFTLGAGLEHWDPFSLVDGPVRYDIFAQYHALSAGVLPRDSGEARIPGYPVAYTGVPIGGNIVVLGGQFGFDY